MGKSSKSKSKSEPAVAPSKNIDPALASLFASSLGVVKAPQLKGFVPTRKAKASEEFSNGDGEEEDEGVDNGSGDDEELSEIEDTDLDASDNDKEEKRKAEEPDTTTDRSRKRKRKAAEEDIEDSYMRKLQDGEPRLGSKKVKGEKKKEKKDKKEKKANAEGNNAGKDSDSDSDSEEETAPKVEFPIKHESLVSATEVELDKSGRTIFLGNVPSNAISSKTDYKTLKTFFSTVGKVSSVRFRSIAFSEQIPRKAAFVNHKLHEKQKTVNAYIVYKDVAAAREALKLNGSIVLDRHIRVDSVAHPGKHDPKRCVFVGNLDFEAQEENLWRHFGVCGKVEYVRVIRDPKTNVGKGFAYVQFEDLMSVEPALLLDGKKMEGDRKLRVSRAKAIKRNTKKPAERPRRSAPKSSSGYVPKVDPKQQATIGRATKLLGRAGASQLKKQVEVFEGMRATANTDSGVKKGGSGKKKGGKARARTTARSTVWKKK